MQSLKENVAYLQGLVQGVDLDPSTKEGRVITSIVDTMGVIAEAMERLETRQSDLEIYLDSLDEELMELEDDIYSLEDQDCVEIECPACHDVVYFDAEILDDEDTIEVTCPNCHSIVFVNDGEYDVGTGDDYNCGCNHTGDKDIIQ